MMKYFALVISAALVGVDQLLKLWVLDSLAPAGQVEMVHGFFYLTYVENRGAAFGIMQSHTSLLSLITSVVLIAAVCLLLSGRIKGRFLTFSLSLVIAGGLGNLIDRVFRGFVVDYIDFSALFGFPVFNFADCCVVVGTCLILCAILWSESEGRAKTPEKEA